MNIIYINNDIQTTGRCRSGQTYFILNKDGYWCNQHYLLHQHDNDDKISYITTLTTTDDQLCLDCTGSLATVGRIGYTHHHITRIWLPTARKKEYALPNQFKRYMTMTAKQKIFGLIKLKL